MGQRRATVESGLTAEALAALIEASPLAVAVMDRAGTVHHWNSAAERLFGWRAEEVVGREPPLAPDAPFVPMEAIEPGTRWTVATKLRENRGGARFRGGDVLFARITPCLENGKVAQWPFHGDRAGGSTEFIVLRARPALDPSFLYYWATSSRVRDAATALMVGSTGRQRLAPGDLAAIPVTMPPIDEQRRIADLLTAIGQAEGASRLLEVEAQRLLRALLHTAIGDEDWDARTLGQVADIRSGITKGRKAKGALVPRPYLRAANVQDGRLDLDDVQTIDVTEEEARRYLLRSGDLLLVEGSGSRARLGTAAAVQTGRRRPQAHPRLGQDIRAFLEREHGSPGRLSARVANQGEETWSKEKISPSARAGGGR